VASIVLVLVMVPLVLPMAAVAPRADDPASEQAQRDSSTGGPVGAADVEACFREETRWEKSFLFLRTASEVRSVSEFWLGDNRAALIEDRFRVILDRSRNLLTYVNPRDRTYVEIDLPMDLDAIFSDELMRKRRELSYGAAVEPTDNTRRVRGYGCREYDLTQWQVKDGARSGYRNAKVYATTEVDADYTLAEELLDNLRVILPRDQASREELRKIRGKQLLFEWERPGSLLVKELLVAEVVEIRREVPPFGVYEIPAGYTRKERLEPSDL
jgi:hypothetical protein